MPITVPDQTIAAQVPEAPSGMTQIGQLLDLDNKRQQITAGGIANQSNQANLDERNKLRDLANDPNVQNPDGSLNSEKFTARAQVVAPTLGAGIAQGNLGNQSTQIANHTAQYGLDKSQTEYGLQLAGGLAQDEHVKAATDPSVMNDPQKAAAASKGIMQTLSDTEDQMVQAGVPKLSAKALLAPMYTAAAHDPAQVQPMLMSIIRKGQSPQGQAGQQLIPTSQQQTPTSDTMGNPAIAGKTEAGNITSLTSQPIAGQTQAPMPSGPLAPGEKDRIAPLAIEYSQARLAALNAPSMHTNNKGILDEMDKVAATGVAGPYTQKILSALGAKFDTPEQKASAYDLVGKYQERAALQAAASMGPQTNAGLEAQLKANGTVSYNPTAIKTVTKLSDAYVSGAQAYAPGLKKAVESDPRRGVLAKEQYDEQWGKVFKPEVMQLYNAAKSGDTVERDRIIDQAGGNGSAGAKNLVLRAQGIQSLMKTGQLPPNFGLK